MQCIVVAFFCERFPVFIVLLNFNHYLWSFLYILRMGVRRYQVYQYILIPALNLISNSIFRLKCGMLTDFCFLNVGTLDSEKCVLSQEEEERRHQELQAKRKAEEEREKARKQAEAARALELKKEQEKERERERERQREERERERERQAAAERLVLKTH